MAYENLKPAADANGHPITQAQWDATVALLQSWTSAYVSAQRICDERRRILLDGGYKA
jgi:hypothetical protein